MESLKPLSAQTTRFSRILQIPNRLARRAALVSACALACGMPQSLSAATSVAQYGITWTFSTDRPVGQFANGDWWVVGPVTLSNISPKSSGASDYTNGSMLNPVPAQAQGLYFDSGTDGGVHSTYSTAKNISLQLPYVVQPGNSVYTVMNNPDSWSSSSGGVVEKTWFKETAVLTVLSAAPPAGSFRPPYAGTDKTIKSNWNVGSMNYGVLRKLTPPNAAHIPNREWLETATKRPLIEMAYDYVNSNWKASWHDPKPGAYPRRTYGREISHISSGAGLFLQTNVSDQVKERLLINMVQWGIDVYGLLNVNMQWWPAGGHNHGRMLPIYLAAKVLNDGAMMSTLNAKASAFQEVSQHWYVTQKHVDTPRAQPGAMAYTSAMIGMPEWSAGGVWEYNQPDANFWAPTYRFICSAPTCGMVATILLMNGRNDLPPADIMFRYIVERHYPLTKGGAAHTLPAYGDSVTLLTRDLWDAYISGIVVPPPTVAPPPDPPAFVIGDRIETWRNTNVRASAALSGTLLGTQVLGSLGTIVAGPISMDSITWWQVNYDAGADGWSGGDNFVKSSTQPPTGQPPSAPTGLKVVE